MTTDFTPKLSELQAPSFSISLKGQPVKPAPNRDAFSEWRFDPSWNQ